MISIPPKLWSRGRQRCDKAPLHCVRSRSGGEEAAVFGTGFRAKEARPESGLGRMAEEAVRLRRVVV